MKWLLGALSCALAISLVGCSQTIPFVARSPAAVFSATACRPALGAVQDVAPPHGRFDRLLQPDPAPSTALVCEYEGRIRPGHRIGRTLAKQTTLSAVLASRLAIAAARIDVGLHPGTSSCASDTDSVAVIVFRFPEAPPVDLWWHSTGCQTIDDGATAAEEGGNDSFFHFRRVFTAVMRAASSP